MRVLVKELLDKPHANAGQVLDLPDAEAKDMITRGTATEAPAELSGAPEPEAEPELAKVSVPVAPVVEPQPTPPTPPVPPVRAEKPKATPKSKRRG